MNTLHVKNYLLFVLSVCLFISCTSSSSGGGVGGSGIISRGAISEFGSIVVNGTEFDTSNAVVIFKEEDVGTGDLAVLNNLDVGRIVTVSGTGSEDEENAVAERVTYSDNVTGPVNTIFDINTSTKEMIVMGQTVMLNALTKFKETSFDAIAVNDMIEVSGFYDDQGTIWASFIEKVGVFLPDLVVEVAGLVENLNTDMETFEINDLTVDYSSADTSNLPEGFLYEGLRVEAEGTLDDAAETLVAASIELGDDLETENADEIEIMGFVTGLFSGVDFIVGNQRVRVLEDAEIVDGILADIIPGAKLEAEGSLEDGILYAEEIEFWEPDQIEIEDFITEFVSIYEFTVGEQVIVTDDGTIFEEGDKEDLMLGVHVEIKGRLMADILYADKVSFE